MRVRQSLVRTMLALVAFVSFTMMASVAVADGVDPHAPLTVTSGGKTFTYATPVSLVDSASVVATPLVEAWVDSIAESVYCKVANASFWVDKKKRKIVFKSAKNGYRVDRPAATTEIINELLAEVGGATAQTVALSTTTTKPKVTSFKKHILVSLKQRKVYLYNNMKLEKTYRCAIGMKAYPTPKGTFYIGKKRKNPDWHRGSAAWAQSMPAYIGPGPSNPLGTRALYVYKKNGADTGVRFHGTTKTSSIGHAASHGCMRMTRKSVEDFFKRVPLKTPVYIIN
jgi:lipoprotein-anchoring transpeptidase ErfK/SrfK